MTPLPEVSVAPAAVTLTEAEVSQVTDPPASVVGACGAVRSIFAVFEAPAVAGTQAEKLPAPSTLRSCTSVEPSEVTANDEPVDDPLQLPPLLVDVRYS